MVKNLPAMAGDVGSIPELGRSPGEGNCNSFQYSCLGNLMDGGAWWAIDHGVGKESDRTQRLDNNGSCFTKGVSVLSPKFPVSWEGRDTTVCEHVSDSPSICKHMKSHGIPCR